MSVLEDRMRLIARDEVGKFVTTDPATSTGTDPLAELREQLAALTARVDELEKTAATPAPAPKRAARKTAEPAEKTAESSE